MSVALPPDLPGLIGLLRQSPLELTGLWATDGRLHLLLRDPATNHFHLTSYSIENNNFPSLGTVRPGAIRLERTIADLHWIIPQDAPDRRAWLDHGRWPASEGSRGSRFLAAAPYPWEEQPEAGQHLIPVGPVHAGIIEPGFFRFQVTGEQVARLETRLGYVHRGVAALMIGRTPAEAAKLAARQSGDSTVAYSLGFATAVEQVTRTAVPPRARLIRTFALEAERLANHLGDIGALFGDVALHALQMAFWTQRETLARQASESFGHRLMMDLVQPGGTGPAGKLEAYGPQLAKIRRDLDLWLATYRHSASARDRMRGPGVIPPEAAAAYAAGGFTGRASGRAFDARSLDPLYQEMGFQPISRTEGDVEARMLQRWEEAVQSIELMQRLLGLLADSDGITQVPLTLMDGEGLALVEGFRGDVLVWLRLAEGRIAAAHLRDPSWFQWPLLEVAIQTAILADFPLVNKSINGSYAGHDG